MDPTNQREMIGISVDTNKFVQVLQTLNNKLKDQDQRLAAVEAALKTFVKQEKYEADLEAARNVQRENDMKFEKANQRITDMAEEYDGRLKEVIVSNQVAVKTVQDGLTSYIEQVAGQVNELKTGEVSPHDADALKREVQVLKKSMGLIDSVDPTDEDRERVARGMTPEEHLRILTEIRVNKANIARLADEISGLGRGGSVEESVAAGAPEEEDFDLGGTDADVLRKLARRVAGLNSKVNKVVVRIENKEREDQKRDEEYRKIVYALIDGLRLVHTHASGMDDIPVQDFATVAPEYFEADPNWQQKSAVYSLSFPAKRLSVMNSARATWRNAEEAAPAQEEGSGRRGKEVIIVQNPGTSRTSTEVMSAAIPARMQSRLSTTTSVVAEIQSQAPDPSMVVGGEPVTSAMVRDLRFMLGCFHRDKDQLMTAIDRKVDRDMVERLFNKFRVMVMQINDRVNEMAALTDKFASQKDVDTMASVIKTMPGFKDNPTCRMSLDISGRTGNLLATDSIVRRSGGAVSRMTLPPLQDSPTD